MLSSRQLRVEASLRSRSHSGAWRELRLATGRNLGMRFATGGAFGSAPIAFGAAPIGFGAAPRERRRSASEGRLEEEEEAALPCIGGRDGERSRLRLPGPGRELR